ncbi:MAG: hypothetical protein ACKV19_27650 [Verrucomicrobiales bacterium]
MNRSFFLCAILVALASARMAAAGPFSDTVSVPELQFAEPSGGWVAQAAGMTCQFTAANGSTFVAEAQINGPADLEFFMTSDPGGSDSNRATLAVQLDGAAAGSSTRGLASPHRLTIPAGTHTVKWTAEGAMNLAVSGSPPLVSVTNLRVGPAASIQEALNTPALAWMAAPGWLPMGTPGGEDLMAGLFVDWGATGLRTVITGPTVLWIESTMAAHGSYRSGNFPGPVKVEWLSAPASSHEVRVMVDGSFLPSARHLPVRGVIIPAGTHSVEWRWGSLYFPPGLRTFTPPSIGLAARSAWVDAVPEMMPLADALDTSLAVKAMEAAFLPVRGWSGQTAVSHDGVDAAVSGLIEDGEASWMEAWFPAPRPFFSGGKHRAGPESMNSAAS